VPFIAKTRAKKRVLSGEKTFLRMTSHLKKPAERLPPIVEGIIWPGRVFRLPAEQSSMRREMVLVLYTL